MNAYLIEPYREGTRVTVESASLRDLFVDAARAVVDQLGASGPARAAAEVHQLSVVAGDAEALLLAWLGEILFHSREAERLFDGAMLHRISSRGLRAELRADHETLWLVDLTSIAVSDARIQSADGRLRAEVTLNLHPIAGRSVSD